MLVSPVTLEGGTRVVGNEAKEENGGGINALTQSIVVLRTNVVLASNKAAKSHGAAIMTEGLSCPNDIGGQEECHIVQSHLDQQFLSWTDYADSQNYPFAPNDALKTLWSRTYARY